MRTPFRMASARLIAVLAAFALIPGIAAHAGDAQRTGYEFATPLFGMSSQRGALFVADAGAGIVKVRDGRRHLVAELPGVTDVAFYGRGKMYAVGGQAKLYRVVDGVVSEIADLGAFEAAVNPDGGEIDSNPFRVAALPRGRALVADAAANALLIVQRDGSVNWVATLPERLAYTRNAKRIAGCPDPAPENAFVCDLPRRIPAQPVATSVAVGPDGAWYVGELKGFPSPKHASRVWRIEPGTRHARCGSSDRCRVVVRGLTSIVDLDFARSGRLHVVEFDEAGWLAVEFGQATTGTVDSCNVWTGNCRVLARLPLPGASASTRRHTFATVLSLVPGEADIVKIG
jgi:hypothetical protein